ncbi:GGDEF domain-containing protein [Halanaerobium hydrogeniformans]|uniref:Diguanylate cyclase n=1 Tax=Halanaerobium hydrogeniformans TaxID=656519 RepID=E4RPQ9_HALHG|nr:GGDEF domain-containing protein [Halanaerobium hydrogeniformans]ADQ13943.1 diguanylate cyclase [Halanaerobium hydrogeniformans]
MKKNIFNKIKYLTVIIIIMLIFFFYFFVFQPLKSELESSLDENFKNSVSIIELNVENKFSRFKEGTESLSSRTMIKNELLAYRDGEVTFKELQDYTEDKYADGAGVLDNVMAAFRITEGELVTAWGDKDFSSYTGYFNYDSQETELTVIRDQCLVLVNSPIFCDDNQKLGNDIVLFNLKDLMEEINRQGFECVIVEKSELENPGFITNETIRDHRRILDTDYYLQAEMSKSQLYERVNNLSTRIIASFSILLLLIALAFYKVVKDTSNEVITDLENKVAKITKISETDDMLGIYNRSKFINILEKEIYRSRRYDNDLSLIMYDIDCFKEINDNYGHQVGDEILIKVTKMIKDQIRKIDSLARYGGDEFMIINPETSLEKSYQLAERLRKEVSKIETEKVASISCSFGVVELEAEDDIDSLLKRADDALYQAKENGRNKVCKL